MKFSALLVLGLGVLIIYPVLTQAQITWDDASNIAPGAPITASGILEIRDAVADIKEEIDTGLVGAWNLGSGNSIYYNNGKVGIGKTNPAVSLDITGQVRTTSDIEAGNGSGSVALTVNDGKGNANVTWNHKGGVPDANGNAARIEVNTDSANNAAMYFELGSGVTAGQDVNLNSIMTLKADGKVGIGTTKPNAVLQIEATTNSNLLLSGGT